MLRLQLAVVQYVAVDVPEQCPRCNASFVDEAKPSLREVTLKQSVFLGSVSVDETEQHFDVADSCDTVSPGYHAVTYHCASCSEVVAG